MLPETNQLPIANVMTLEEEVQPLTFNSPDNTFEKEEELFER